jgi:hypothetical protein
MTANPTPIPVHLDARLWTEAELMTAAARILCGLGLPGLSPAAVAAEINRRQNLSAHERIADERRRRGERPELGK